MLWELMEATEKAKNAAKPKDPRTLAMTNLRQIGMVLFEFERDYGAFPNEKTAAAVKQATETNSDLKAETANDCFFQLIASGLMVADHLFRLDHVQKEDRNPKPPASLEKCGFSYFSGMNAAVNPARPLVVAPLVRGKTTFDPAILGGQAVVLRVDNSVQSFPIGDDGRVMIDGRDLFDPAQPFWNGEVPPIRWPKD